MTDKKIMAFVESHPTLTMVLALVLFTLMSINLEG
mgnify:FL=1